MLIHILTENVLCNQSSTFCVDFDFFPSSFFIRLTFHGVSLCHCPATDDMYF